METNSASPSTSVAVALSWAELNPATLHTEWSCKEMSLLTTMLVTGETASRSLDVHAKSRLSATIEAPRAALGDNATRSATAKTRETATVMPPLGAGAHVATRDSKTGSRQRAEPRAE